ncbi:hypothetical protein, partial [Glaesserella parasuis]|uniref:hypothetical protein n=1 Tax=Glaesserella parasuis TaxID=738 RepID=UPI003B67A567
KVDCLILGMIKMIIQEDPIIDELIEMGLDELDLPDSIQHFTPCIRIWAKENPITSTFIMGL